MTLPRGFKAKANRIAVGIRRQMGLCPEAPVDLRRLAERLKIPLVPLTMFADELPDSVRQLGVEDLSAFSAVLIPLDQRKRVILYNDSHSIPRQNSSIAHELSHVLLFHPISPLFASSGHRTMDNEIEQEANCLAAYILIPNEAAMRIVWYRKPLCSVRERYGVSKDMLEFRLNESGARKRKARAQSRSV